MLRAGAGKAPRDRARAGRRRRARAAARRRRRSTGRSSRSASATSPTSTRRCAKCCACSRPGARFVILEFSTPRIALVRAGYHLYFHRVLPLVGRLVSGHRTAYSYLPASVAHFPAEEELAARMTAAGFARRALGVAVASASRRSTSGRSAEPAVSASASAQAWPSTRSGVHRGHRRGRRAAPDHAAGEGAPRDLRDHRPRVEDAGRRARRCCSSTSILRDGTRSPFPVAINLFGSMRRMALALGVDRLDEHGERITRAARPQGAGRDAGQAVDAAAAVRGGEVPAAHEEREARRARRSCGAATRSTSTSCRSSPAGRTTAGRTSR